MKRYGDNLPSSCMEETENQSGETKYLAGNCAVRQDMVAFIMPADASNNRKTWNLFSLFGFGRKKTNDKGG
ncbi:MAG: hypothetical protein IPP66_22670 [Anaerolineales bacterium]|nr:hypothetical protein [Anaerolineales bacterium]